MLISRIGDLATKGIEFTTAKQIFGQDLKSLMAMVGGGGQNNVVRTPLGYLDEQPPSWTNAAKTKHSLGGELVGNSLKGVHHVPSNPNITNVSIPPGYKSNQYGFYEADIEVVINGQSYTKYHSTQWPDDWSQAKILEEADFAFANKNPTVGNQFEGTTSQGVTVRFYVDPLGNYNFHPVL